MADVTRILSQIEPGDPQEQNESCMVCHLYSDVSKRHEAIGYCCIIEDGYGERCITGSLTSTDNTSVAEIEALTIGLHHCDIEADRVIAYSDLDWLPHCMRNNKRGRARATRKAIRNLCLAAEWFHRVEWQLVSPKNESYRKCHRISRQKAIDAANGTESADSALR